MTSHLLSLRNVTLRFGGLTAIDDLSVDVEKGSVHAIIGPNGAGKSTTFNVISGMYPANTGDIVFNGSSIKGRPAHSLAKLGIARTFQNIELCSHMTVLDTVLAGMASQIGAYIPFLPSRARREAEGEALTRAEEMIERLGLKPYRDTKASDLDFGHQKALDIARAVAIRPQLLMLDEPAAGLRSKEIGNLIGLLMDLRKDYGLTIVLVEHVMPMVMAIADKITVLNFGKKIAEGNPAEVRRNAEVIQAYLGTSHA